MEEIKTLYEEGVFVAKNTFEMESDKTKEKTKSKTKTRPFVSSPSGPKDAEGVKDTIIDPKDSKDDNFYTPKKFSQNCIKTETRDINNVMNKSIFDRLYEDVMSDDIDSDTESLDRKALNLTDDTSETDDTSDEVTVTLDKELARKLYEVLGSVVDLDVEDEDLDVGDEDFDSDDDFEVDDSDEDQLEEATELEELPLSRGASLQNKNNKVRGTATSLKSSGSGDGKVAGEIDSKGKDVPNSKGESLQGKNNKVDGKTSKVGAYLAGVK